MSQIKNKDIRMLAVEHDVKMWEIADILHISPETLSRRLRRELKQNEKEKIRHAINDIAKRHLSSVK